MALATTSLLVGFGGSGVTGGTVEARRFNSGINSKGKTWPMGIAVSTL
ncbi:MAG TPA: hypothetical protein VLG28_15950 [Acidimicrobiia bacterium]|nr:hypothetical protein [Acidimicrobiia bacterium]